jgi:putative endonuclease
VTRRALGRFGERFAAEYLERALGWRVERKNWRCRWGELDLVARTPSGVLVIVEVRTRRTDGYGAALESVTAGKRARLARLTRLLLADWTGPAPAVVRVDVIGLTVRGRRVVAMEHIRGAIESVCDE